MPSRRVVLAPCPGSTIETQTNSSDPIFMVHGTIMILMVLELGPAKKKIPRTCQEENTPKM
eukprot:50865-Amphidinium_carterae.1